MRIRDARVERQALGVAQRLRHAEAHADLLTQAGVQVHRAVRAGQQHRRFIAAVVAQPQPETTGGALADQQRQLALLQAIAHVGEQPGGVEPLDTRAQIAQRNPRGRLEPERARQKRGRHDRSPGHSEPHAGHQDGVRRRGCRGPGRHPAASHLGLDLRKRGTRRRLASRHQLAGAPEAEARERAHVRHDEHVACAALGALRIPHAERHRLRQHVHQRHDRITRLERVGHVAADQHVRAQGARVPRRQVAHHAAVDQDVRPELDGSEHARQRHAGADRVREKPPVQHHRLAGLEVGRDGRERDGEPTEIVDAVRRPGEPGQELPDALTRHDALRKLDAAAIDREGEQQVIRGGLAIDRQVAPVHGIGEQAKPVLAAHDRVELGRTVADRVQPAHDAAHTRSGDHVHRNARLLQHFQHADVREAARRASTQGNADLAGLCVRREHGPARQGGEHQSEYEHEPRWSHGAPNRSRRRPPLQSIVAEAMWLRAQNCCGPAPCCEARRVTMPCETGSTQFANRG